MTAEGNADPGAPAGRGGMVGQLQARATAAMSGFSTGQKVMTGLALLAVVVGGYLFTSWAGKPTYTPLFTNLDPADAASITQKLASSKTSYKLADSGRTVLVPQSSVYQLRINMSSAGLPAGSNTGYKLLDKQGITTSEFQQRIDYQRAIEGELAKTVESIDGVAAATVHVVIPASDVFADDSHKPSASVLVSNTPGHTLAPTQVQAVVHLVSSSIEGLDPGAVTVADSKGNVLSAPGSDSAATAAGDAHTAQTKTVEDATSASVQSMLATVLGPGRAVVRVKADLDFDSKDTTTQVYDPTKQVPVSSATTSESFTGTGASAAAGGVLGAATGTAPATTGTTGPGGNSYTKSSNNQSYAVSVQSTQQKAAPGTIRRLSVAVVMDSASKADPAQISRLVSAAAGVQSTRGDSVVVEQAAFDKSGSAAASKELQKVQAARAQAGMLATARTVAVLVVVIVLVLLALRRMGRTTRRTPLLLPADLQTLALGPGPSTGAAARAGLGAAGQASLPGGALAEAGLRGGTATLTLDRPDLGLSAGGGAEVATMIERNPEEVAELLRSWLADRRG